LNLYDPNLLETSRLGCERVWPVTDRILRVEDHHSVDVATTVSLDIPVDGIRRLAGSPTYNSIHRFWNPSGSEPPLFSDGER